MNKALRPRWILPGLAIVLLSLSACQSEEVLSRQSFVFGTLVEVKIRTSDRDQAIDAINTLFSRFDKLHSNWHAWKPGAMTDTSAKLSQGEWFTPAASITPVLEYSQQLYRDSRGLFNPAMGRLVALWGFHADTLPDKPPEKSAIDSILLDLPGMDDIEFNNGRVRGHHPHIVIDAGGMAKGYAVNMGIELLRRHGISNALLNAGGDLCGIGSRGDRAWRVGIRHPNRQGVLASIDLSDGECVFTSGDYERGYDYENHHYHHIIDPRTGYPADGAVSVTVLHPNGALADAASTALLVAGVDGWQEIAESMNIDKVLLVDHQGRLHMTAGMQKRVVIRDNPPQEIIIAPQI